MKNLLYILLLSVVFTSCGDDKEVTTVAIEPSEEVINGYNGEHLAVVLEDMKIDENENSITYKHKYNVLKMVNDSLHEDKKDWSTVNHKFFEDHKNDLGMEILSKHKGIVSRVAQPVGLGWAVGNEKHGEWVEDKQKDSVGKQNNGRRWRHYASSPFLWYWIGSRRSMYRSNYNNYRSHHNSGRPFYGSNSSSGNYTYGTRSSYQQNRKPSFFSRQKSNSSRWSRSSRSSSRYSSGSSTRSRSGGHGK